jgi:hypothetical protein
LAWRQSIRTLPHAQNEPNVQSMNAVFNTYMGEPVLHFGMAFRTNNLHKALFVALLISVCARLFTGAPEAQVNFMGLMFDGGTSQTLVQNVSQQSLGVSGPISFDSRSASSIPPKSAEYKLYKKYVQPDKSFQIVQNFKYKANQIIISILATSYYLKDLTLKSLHSNSPPTPVSTLLFIVFMYLLIVRIGVFGNYGEIKNIRDRRFSLQ